MEGTEMRLGICWVLKEDQYLDSGVCLGVLAFDFSFGFTGKFFRTLASSIFATSHAASQGLGFKSAVTVCYFRITVMFLA